MNRAFQTFSIGLNFVMLGILFFCLKPARVFTQQKSGPQNGPSFPSIIVQTTNIIEATNSPIPAAKFHWRDIESEDYQTYIANLRAIRCPEKTIFDIIFADIEKLYAEREKQMEALEKFWLTGDDLEKARFAKLDKEFALQEEKFALVKTLLDSELVWEVMEFWYEQRELGVFAGFLPDTQAERALSVAMKFVNRIELVDQRAGGLLIPEDAEEKKKLYSEMRSALGGIISTAELEEAELRVVCLISYLFSNSDLKNSKLTGHELRQIMLLKWRFDNPLTREFDDETDSPLPEQKFLEQVHAFLGETRFQQFLRAHDNEFDQLCTLTEENGLQSQIAKGVYEIRQMALLESARISEDRTLRRKEKRLELEALEQSTREAVQQLLGEEIIASYSTNGGGWLKGLGKP